MQEGVLRVVLIDLVNSYPHRLYLFITEAIFIAVIIRSNVQTIICRVLDRQGLHLVQNRQQTHTHVHSQSTITRKDLLQSTNSIIKGQFQHQYQLAEQP